MAEKEEVYATADYNLNYSVGGITYSTRLSKEAKKEEDEMHKETLEKDKKGNIIIKEVNSSDEEDIPIIEENRQEQPVEGSAGSQADEENAREKGDRDAQEEAENHAQKVKEEGRAEDHDTLSPKSQADKGSASAAKPKDEHPADMDSRKKEIEDDVMELSNNHHDHGRETGSPDDESSVPDKAGEVKQEASKPGTKAEGSAAAKEHKTGSKSAKPKHPEKDGPAGTHPRKARKAHAAQSGDDARAGLSDDEKQVKRQGEDYEEWVYKEKQEAPEKGNSRALAAVVVAVAVILGIIFIPQLIGDDQGQADEGPDSPEEAVSDSQGKGSGSQDQGSGSGITPLFSEEEITFRVDVRDQDSKLLVSTISVDGTKYNPDTEIRIEQGKHDIDITLRGILMSVAGEDYEVTDRGISIFVSEIAEPPMLKGMQVHDAFLIGSGDDAGLADGLYFTKESSGEKLFYCERWDKQARSCEGGKWVKAEDLEKGETYSAYLEPGAYIEAEENKIEITL